MDYDKPKVTIDLDEYLELKQLATENKRDNGALPVGTSISMKHPTSPTKMFYKISNVFVGDTYIDYTLNGSFDNIYLTIHSIELAKTKSNT